MKTSLIKIMDEEDIDVKDLTENNISEYIQTKRTIDQIQNKIIHPYTTWDKNSNEEILAAMNNLTIEYSRKKIQVKRNDEDVINTLRGSLDNMLRNNSNGKNMFGVRRFEGTPCIDTSYLINLLNDFTTETIGTRTEEGITYRGKKIDKVTESKKGELMFALVNYSRILQRIQTLSGEDMTIGDSFLYICANEETKKLNDIIIRPFEDAFKEQAEKSKSAILFDVKEYGGLAVQVKTTPEEKTNYTLAKELLDGRITDYAMSQVMGQGIFLNDQLLEARPYVSIGKVLGGIAETTNKTETKFNQEINILYNPKDTIILTE